MDAYFFFEVATWTIIAALIVFVVMNAGKVAMSTSSIGGWAMNEEGIMTGGLIK